MDFSTSVLNSGDLNHDYNDRITSIKPAIGTCIVAYQHSNYSGTSKQFIHDVNTLVSYNFNDTISSLRIMPDFLCTDAEKEIEPTPGPGPEPGCIIGSTSEKIQSIVDCR